MIRYLTDLPNGDHLKKLCQSIATLEIILMPQWDRRYYSYQKEWISEVDVFSMRDGSGDEMFVIFTLYGVIIKGFAHESSLSPYRVNPPKLYEGILNDIPNELKGFINEPAFLFDETTFCLWQIKDSNVWLYGREPSLQGKDLDGSQRLLSIFDGSPETYQNWASNYYERFIPLNSVKAIYAHLPLSLSLIMSLNLTCDLKTVINEVHQIQYPIQSS